MSPIAGQLPIIFVILVATVWIALRRRREQMINVKHLLLMPVLFMCLSLYGIWQSFAAHSEAWVYWVVALLIGLYIGWKQVKNKQLSFDTAKKQILVSPDWSWLILILAVFGAEFYLIYEVVSSPLVSDIHWLSRSLFISGLFTGVVIGRSATYYQRYQQAE
jgi:hypothetical protein